MINHVNVGIIGYGRFGALAAKYIARQANVVVYDPRTIATRFPSKRMRAGTLAEAAACQVVLLATPISSLKTTVKSIARFVAPGALVLDVCAVKSLPLQWMKAALPTGVSIIGTHPLFGPDTATRSLHGHRIVLCPVRVSRGQSDLVLRVLRAAGLDVMVMTPDLHDRMMAETLFLTQYVGRWVKEARAQRWPHSTPTYDRLMEVVRVAEHDTRELFKDMWKYNLHARRLARKLELSAMRVRRDLI